ncbi:CTAG/Pcc1 family [Dillenia turbinata]|uniref:CTAG/Pcc1 family n=1 Tax=Dillenia turbinata TaxID=194707 RepID=A0AAN8Z5U0_9MAGN
MLLGLRLSCCFSDLSFVKSLFSALPVGKSSVLNILVNVDIFLFRAFKSCFLIFPYSNLEVDYESEEKASIVYSTLTVDKKLQPDKVKRHVNLAFSVIISISCSCQSFMEATRFHFPSLIVFLEEMVGALLVIGTEEHDDVFLIAYIVNNSFCTPVQFEAVDSRFLRASYSAFMDVLALATNTIEEFSPRTKFCARSMMDGFGTLVGHIDAKDPNWVKGAHLFQGIKVERALCYGQDISE